MPSAVRHIVVTRSPKVRLESRSTNAMMQPPNPAPVIRAPRQPGWRLDGIDAGRGQSPLPLIMLHYDNGADTKGTKQFYDTFNGYSIPYDIIGLSYYPWWHGNLLGLRDNILSILENYPDKDVIVVEVGYRPHEYEESELAPYPVNAPGGPRKAFLEAVNEMLLGISSRRVKGLFWWEPASDCGRDYFDEACNALPVITVFDRFKRY